MALNRAVVSRAVVVLSLVVLSCATRDADKTRRDPLLRDCTRASLESRLDMPQFLQADAERIISTCGVEILPTLTEILNDEDVAPRVRAAAAMCIGKSGAPEAAKTLIEFIESPQPGPVDSWEENTAVTAAMHGLAHLGTDESISFLKLLCTEAYWLGRDDRALLITGKSGRGVTSFTVADWQQAALGATLALDPRKRLDVVRELRDTPGTENIQKSIDDNIRYYERRRWNPLIRLRERRSTP